MAKMAPELFEQLRRTRTSRRRNWSPSTPPTGCCSTSPADLIARCGPGEVAVVDDGYGALTLGAVALHGARDVRVAQDLLVGELALARNAERTGLTGTYRSVPLGPELATGARVVLVQAPKALDALREIAEVVAASAAPDVTVLVGGRVKHMTHAMNDVLRRLVHRGLGEPGPAEVAGARRARAEAGRRRPSRAARTIPTSG